MSQPPIQPDDFYEDEHGRVVFTEAYHLRRGHCCGSGCRHCPWRDTGADATDQTVDSNALT